MLSDEVIEKVTERLVERMNNANLFVIKRIARKIKQIRSIVPSSSHDIIQVMDYGGDLDKIVRELSKATSLTVKEIYELFEEVAKADQHFAKKYYEYKKKKFIPYEENQRLKDEVEAVARMTAENFINLSQTRGIGYVVKDKEGNLIFKDVSTLYKDVVDEGIISISQGKSSFDDEMSKLIKQIGKSGLKSVVYESGRTRRIDSALRMNISDGIRELRHKTQEIYGEEFGADGWEITVHGYPAPDHAEVQGRQFSKEEFDKFQNDEDAKSYDGKLFPAMSEETGHDRRAIGQYNCYHNTFAIVLGITKPTYSEEQLRQIIEDNEKGFIYGDKHYTLYEGSQLQRKMETEIRKQKDIQIMGVESNNKDVAEEAQREIDRLVNEYYELSKISGLPTRLDRIQVEGYKEIPVSDEKPKIKKDIKIEGIPVVKISKEENERLANIWLNYYEEQGERLRPFEAQRNNELLGGKINGFKNETIKLDNIENCQKLLNKVNGKIETDKGDIDKIDIRLLAECSEGMYEVTRKSPALLEDLKANRQYLRAEKINPVGETFMNSITLNTNYFSDYDSFKKMCVEQTELHNYLDGKKHSWWTPTAKGMETRQTIYHEMGHRLQSAIYYRSTSESNNPIGFNFWFDKYGEISEYSGERYIPYESSKKIKRDLIYEPIRRLQVKEGLTQKEIIDKYVSMYGRKTYEEMFAEMFANSQLGESNALGDELIAFLKELGEWYDE